MQQILYLVGSHHPDTFPPLDGFWCMIWLWFWSHVPFFVQNLKPFKGPRGRTPVPVLTLCSSRTQLRTWRQASTPNSSKGRCSGKSTMEKRELSGRAKVSGLLSSWGSTSTSTRLWPATGTGERSNRYTQDSISRRSASSWLPFSSTDSAPVNTRHMVSLGRTLMYI